MAYAHTDLSTAATLLSQRLSDPGRRFYTLPELYASIRESLRLWNAITSQDRARGTLPTSSGAAFYALPTTLRDASLALLRPQTLLDSDLVTEIRFHLLEDVLATDMVSTAQIVAALQQSRDRFISDTGCALTARVADFIAGGGDGTFDFPDSVTSVRRAVFVDSTGRFYTLSKSDERAATAFSRDWQTPGRPRSYSLSAPPSLRIRLIPPPANSGNLHTYVTATGAAFDSTQAASTLLGVPDDYAWAVKWGAIAMLLASDGPGSDPDRAARAGKLYKLGVTAATRIATILHAEIDGTPAIPASIFRTDRFQGGWESKSSARPRLLSIVGPDVIALTPVPDSALHSVSLDVVCNTLVPTLAASQLQIGREHLSAILGYAQWLCVFKCGGEELEAADPYFEGFFAEAQMFAFQRAAASTALQSALGIGSQQSKETPFQVDPSVSTRNADEIRQERNLRRRAPGR